MSRQLMINRQQRDALWTLVSGQATRLAVGRSPRQLHVVEGVLWLTTQGRRDAPAEDICLQPGESIDLSAGSEWVVEALQAGRFQMLVPQPQPKPWPPVAWTRLSGWLRAFIAAVAPRGVRA